MKWTGFYSVSMDAHFGHSIWSTPNGEHVKVTCTSLDGLTVEKMNEAYQWGDLVFVGEVVDQVGNNPLLALELDEIDRRYNLDYEDYNDL